MEESTMIREAAPSDGEALASLTRELGYQSTPDTAAERLSALAQGDRDAVLIAVRADAVVGWIHITQVLSLESGPFAEIRGLVVTSSLRGRGIGGQLITAAEAWAKDHRLDRMRVRSNIVRTEARRFYERRGYSVTKTQNVFDKPLR